MAMAKTNKNNLKNFVIISTSEALNELDASVYNDKNLSVFYSPISNIEFVESNKDFLNRVFKKFKTSERVSETFPVSFDTLYALHKKGMLPLNAETGVKSSGMEFQRKGGVFTKQWASNLIVDALKGIVVPAITASLTVNSFGQYEIILSDGQQRALAIASFLNGDFAITGTGTALDGSTYPQICAENSDLANAIERCTVDMQIANPIISRKMPGYKELLYFKRNTTVNKLTPMETLNARFWANPFYRNICKDIDEGNGKSKIGRLIYNKATDSADYSVTRDRMAERERLFYGFAAATAEASVNTRGNYEFINRFYNMGKFSTLENLFVAAENKSTGKQLEKELRETMLFMFNNYGDNYAHSFCPCKNEHGTTYLVNENEDANTVTGWQPLARRDKVSSIHFYACTAVSYTFYKNIYKKSSEVSKAEGDLIRSVTERVFLSPEFLELRHSSNTKKVQLRNAIVIKTVLEHMIANDVFMGDNCAQKTEAAQSLVDAYNALGVSSATLPAYEV